MALPADFKRAAPSGWRSGPRHIGLMGFVLHDYQTTVKTRASLTGTGVHSGKEVSISFLPADADTGIVFQLVNREGPDGEGQGREFRALFSEIGATDLCTMLGDPSGEHIATVEHIMAALFGLGIDNVVIEIDGHEVPILDGSAMAFVEAIDQAGIETLQVKATLHQGRQAGPHRERRFLG